MYVSTDGRTGVTLNAPAIIMGGGGGGIIKRTEQYKECT